MMIKAIIFDLGGVIVSPEVEKISSTIASYLGIEYSQFEKFMKKYKSSLTMGEISLFHVYSKLIEKFNLKKITAKEILEKHLNIFQNILTNLNEEVISLVKNLRKNYLVVCLANAELDVVPLVRRRGIYDLFEGAYISTELGMKKPDVEIYLTILKKINCKPKEVVFIDDKKKNVDTAKKLGMFGIHYKYRDNLEKKLTFLSIKTK